MSGHLWGVVVAGAFVVATAACGTSDDAVAVTEADAGIDSSTSTSSSAGGNDPFCEAMGQLIVLLAPSGPVSPTDTEATFTEAATWFEQAEASAPASIADDVSAYAAAYAEYTAYLASVGFNLDTVFSTPEGTQIAIDTSHTITPEIVAYATGPCGLSFGEEVREPTDIGGDSD